MVVCRYAKVGRLMIVATEYSHAQNIDLNRIFHGFWLKIESMDFLHFLNCCMSFVRPEKSKIINGNGIILKPFNHTF